MKLLLENLKSVNDSFMKLILILLKIPHKYLKNYIFYFLFKLLLSTSGTCFNENSDTPCIPYSPRAQFTSYRLLLKSYLCLYRYTLNPTQPTCLIYTHTHIYKCGVVCIVYIYLCKYMISLQEPFTYKRGHEKHISTTAEGH